MHVSSLYDLSINNLKGSNVVWRRPKTNEEMSASLTVNERNLAEYILLFEWDPPPSIRTIQRAVKDVGARAGYYNVSPMTYRHTRACALLDRGWPYNEVASYMGCTWGVLERHYARLKVSRITTEDLDLVH